MGYKLTVIACVGWSDHRKSLSSSSIPGEYNNHKSYSFIVPLQLSSAFTYVYPKDQLRNMSKCAINCKVYLNISYYHNLILIDRALVSIFSLWISETTKEKWFDYGQKTIKIKIWNFDSNLCAGLDRGYIRNVSLCCTCSIHIHQGRESRE